MNFILPQLLLNGLIAGSIYALTALGFAIIYRTVRFFHFAHGAVYAVGAYLAFTFVIQLQMPGIIGFFLPRSVAGWSDWQSSGWSIDRFAIRKPPISST